ncbi:MAG: hypothetical protein J4G18_16345 [Anaerolineae bacterium]|nr:hypothetical protein [Anaerolineae bacterium]
MLTDDIRLERIEGEYQTTRRAQDRVFDSMNGLGEQIERLEEAVQANSEGIAANSEGIAANREELLLLRQAVAENSRMLAALIEHLDVPYRPMGFGQGS